MSDEIDLYGDLYADTEDVEAVAEPAVAETPEVPASPPVILAGSVPSFGQNSQGGAMGQQGFGQPQGQQQQQMGYGQQQMGGASNQFSQGFQGQQQQQSGQGQQNQGATLIAQGATPQRYTNAEDEG